MSLINDALKQARKDPPVDTPNSPPPLQPVQSPPSGTPAWLWPALVILLIVVAVCFIGWAMSHRAQNPVATESMTVATTNTVVARMPQTLPTPPTTTNVQVMVAQSATNAVPPAVEKPFVLKLQGIDYSAKTPSAILNGKTVRAGDVFHEYRVKTILQDSVILIGPDNRPVQLGI